MEGPGYPLMSAFPLLLSWCLARFDLNPATNRPWLEPKAAGLHHLQVILEFGSTCRNVLLELVATHERSTDGHTTCGGYNHPFLPPFPLTNSQASADTEQPRSQWTGTFGNRAEYLMSPSQQYLFASRVSGQGMQFIRGACPVTGSC